jgi:TRAP-type transport system large permease protein
MGILVLFGSLLILLFIGSPVILALGTSALLYFLVVPGKFALLGMYSENFFSGMNSFLLLCMPLFIMAGEIMKRNQMINEIVDFANLLVGRLRGGLAYMCVLACMFFGGISGSALAEVSAIGPVAVKAMKDDGYPPAFAAALTATAALQGPIIPPSLPMVIFASVTNTSVGALFLGGAIPGIMLGLAMMFVIFLQGQKRNFPKSQIRTSWHQVKKVVMNSFFSLIMPLVIIGGIVTGAFTPTESAAVAVAYALIITLIGPKRKALGFKEVRSILLDTTKMTSQVYLIIAFALLLSWIFAMENVPSIVSDFVKVHHMSPYLLLFFVNVFFLINGCFISDVLQIVLFAPIFVPIFGSMGIHPIHFGIVMVVNVVIGMVTPPYGTALYLASAVSGVSLKEIVKETIPFTVSVISVLFLITYIPWFVLFLPRVFGFVR